MPTLAVLPGYGGNTPVRSPLRALRLATMLTEQERKERIGYVIRTARERRGLTPPELAEKVGRSRGTINDWEAARSSPNMVDLGLICAALEIEPRVFAELPAIPVDPIAEYLIPTAASGVEEGMRRGRRRRAAQAPDKPAPSPRPRARDTEAGHGRSPDRSE